MTLWTIKVWWQRFRSKYLCKVSIIIDFPWYCSLLCVLAGAVYALAMYWRSRNSSGISPFGRATTVGLALLRGLAVALIAFLFLSPLVKRDTSRKEKPIVVIAEDNSQSLNYCDDSSYYNGEFRREMDRLAERLGEDFEVHRYRYGATLESADENGGDGLYSGQLTNMAGAIGEIGERYYHRNVGAMILTGDGIYNEGMNPLSAAATLTVPVYTVAMGDTTEYRDVSVANVRVNRVAYLGNRFPMDITVVASKARGQQAALTVTCDGKKLLSKEIAIDETHFSTTESITLDADKAGIHHYTVEVRPVEGERSTRNNRQTVAVDVIDGHQKVAIIAAVPHPDIAALRSAVEQNRNCQVEVFLAKDFDKNPEEYNLLILHQLPSKVAESNIDVSALLKRGTPAIVVLGGQTDLSRLNALHIGLEVYARIERYNEASAIPDKSFTFFKMDEEAARRLGEMPPLLSPFGEYKLGGNAQTLMTARIGTVNSGLPLIALTQQQDRRYSFIAGEGLWRWRMADYQAHGNHDDFDELINKLVVFTALRVDKERFHVETKRLFAQNEAVTFEAQLYDDNYEPVNKPDVELTINDSRYLFNRTVTGYSLNVGIMEPGRYSYTATVKYGGKSYKASGGFSVEQQQREALNTVADHSLLATLAASTGGAMVEARETGSLLEMISARDDIHTLIFSETTYSDMLNMPLLLILIVLLLGVEWVVRKYNGEV